LFSSGTHNHGDTIPDPDARRIIDSPKSSSNGLINNMIKEMEDLPATTPITTTNTTMPINKLSPALMTIIESAA
jgi:hypothetical protein